MFCAISEFNKLSPWLHSFCRLDEGRYLIAHKAGEPFVTLLKEAAPGKVSRGAYNLQQLHGSVPQPPASGLVPWIPLDPLVVLPFHQAHCRVPCTFPPKVCVCVSLCLSLLLHVCHCWGCTAYTPFHMYTKHLCISHRLTWQTSSQFDCTCPQATTMENKTIWATTLSDLCMCVLDSDTSDICMFKIPRSERSKQLLIKQVFSIDFCFSHSSPAPEPFKQTHSWTA